MIWTLVVLTLSGGYSADQPSLAECVSKLLSLQTSRILEGYCMSPTKVYTIKRGKLAEVGP
jgi:hypothetical protein